MRQIKEVLRLAWGQGLKVRQITRCCDVSRPTVSDYLERAKQAGLQWPLPETLDDLGLERLLFPVAADDARTKLDMPDWKTLHAEILTHKHLTLQLLWEEYRLQHPNGYQYSQFCHHYGHYCKCLHLSMRQVHRAGEKVFTDFAGPKVPIYDATTGQVIFEASIFVGVLGASNYSYAEAVRTQNKEDLIKAHVHMFEYFGGVPDQEVPDNLKAAVNVADPYEPELNPSFHDLAMHYGIAVIPARPRKPKDKAKVEKGVQVVERWILAALRHRCFSSLSQLNQAIKELLIKLNERPFKKMEGSRKSWFERFDKPALKPLPAMPYAYSQWTKARVGIDYHIEFQRHYYSVPYPLAGLELDVCYTDTMVEILQNNTRVCSHIRSYQAYGQTTVIDHMPPSHQHYVQWTPDRILHWAATIGPATADMAQVIMDRKPHPAMGFRACLGLLRLAKEFTAVRLEAACIRARKADASSYQHVKTLLKNNLDQKPLPQQAPPSLNLDHENIRGADFFSAN